MCLCVVERTPANALVSSCFHVYADAEQARRLNGQMYEAICGVKGWRHRAGARPPTGLRRRLNSDLDERADDTGENGEHAENGETGVDLGAESDEEPPAGRPGSREQLRIDVGDGEGGPAGRPGWTEAATDPRRSTLHRQMADMDLKERKEPRPRRSIFASLRRS
ncbi:hypothetical protein FJT64_026372 [Amphibalanus amphitrite]|uniref:Uncharacterized protein n=1 Tax=Amphibalanus amphitrite TaxID=1232801 RepID=A0A6A4VZK1_AMPAM|nr:hypothetical protein FJT64_026372 [Amphibalanus amphitrite]